jgi:hypothetical protein
MKPFEKRFRDAAPADLIERLTKAPAGTTARAVRDSGTEIVFCKTGRWHWRNDFRAQMTNRQVASVLAEPETAEYTVADAR